MKRGLAMWLAGRGILAINSYRVEGAADFSYTYEINGKISNFYESYDEMMEDIKKDLDKIVC